MLSNVLRISEIACTSAVLIRVEGLGECTKGSCLQLLACTSDKNDKRA